MEEEMNDNFRSLLNVTDELVTTKDEFQQVNMLAYKDALTGVNNKMAYDEQVTELRSKMKKGYKDFALAIVDLNDLKGINDTYGHEQGNAAIIKVCRTICDTFSHSPVYRIGGDEFVVLLENRDYKNIDTLIQKFDEAMNHSDSTDPKENITAAIGYARCKPGDTIEQVFERADQAMYACKKNMKGEA